jgi:hypothetical protein
MNAFEAAKSERFSGYKILVLAVAFSFIWHIFWLSMIKVVGPAPTRSSQVRLSRVSFLGQIFAKVSLEVRAQPAGRSLLEKRYNTFAGRIGQRSAQGSAAAMTVKPEPDDGVNKDADSALSHLISEAVSGAKAEPGYDSE